MHASLVAAMNINEACMFAKSRKLDRLIIDVALKTFCVMRIIDSSRKLLLSK